VSLANQFASLLWEYVAVAALAFAVDRAVMAHKWNLLLRARKIFISFFEALRLFLVGNLIGLVTPGGVGLDVYRVVAMRDKASKVDIVAISLLERVIGLMAIVVCVLIALPYSIERMPLEHGAWKWLTVACAVSLVLAGVALSSRFSQPLIQRLGARLSNSPMRVAIDLAKSFSESTSSHRVLAKFSAWTLVEVLIMVSVVYFCARAVGAQLPFSFFAVVVPITLLLSRLPISFDGVGVSESAYVMAFQAAGYPGETGLGVGLLVRAIRLAVAQIPAALMMMSGRERPGTLN